MSTNELITIGALAAFVLLLLSVQRFDRRRRRRTGSTLSGMVGAFDEVFHPEAARASEIREVQLELPAEAPAPEDPADGVQRSEPVEADPRSAR